jgi:tetratricopeptide (TPR) repeat protein
MELKNGNKYSDILNEKDIEKISFIKENIEQIKKEPFDPKLASFLYEKGTSLKNKQCYNKAIEIFEILNKYDKKNTLPSNCLGIIYLKKIDYNNELLKKYKNHVSTDYFINFKNDLKKEEDKNYTTSIKYFTEALEKDEENPKNLCIIYGNLGNCYLYKSQYNLAYQNFEEAIQIIKKTNLNIETNKKLLNNYKKQLLKIIEIEYLLSLNITSKETAFSENSKRKKGVEKLTKFSLPKIKKIVGRANKKNPKKLIDLNYSSIEKKQIKQNKNDFCILKSIIQRTQIYLKIKNKKRNNKISKTYP